MRFGGCILSTARQPRGSPLQCKEVTTRIGVFALGLYSVYSDSYHTEPPHGATETARIVLFVGTIAGLQ